MVANTAERLETKMLLKRLLQEFSSYIRAAGGGEEAQTLVVAESSPLNAAFPCLLELSV